MPIGLLNNNVINDLRTSLLTRNLNPTAEATLGGVGSLNNTRGEPTQLYSDSPSVPINQDNVATLGYYQLKNLSLKNRYNPPDFKEIELINNFALAGNIGEYTDYSRTAVPPNFNLRQLALSRPTSVGYRDTPLGIIGLEQLKFSLQANIAQNTIKNTLGRINLNLFSLLNGEEFLIRDYEITQFPNTGLGFLGNLLEKYSGFEIPVSILPKGVFGFLDSLFDGKVNYAKCNLEDLTDNGRMGSQSTIDRNNLLLRYTGKGNRVQLFNMLGTNKYRPNYNSQNGGGPINRIFGFLQQQTDNEAASYDRLEKTRRSTGVLPVMARQEIAFTPFIENDYRSVLQENGLPKITWTNKDKPNDFKRFMFSIENLAWIGYTDGLPECEIGNGDTDSNDKRPGRIMWFPPYDLSFDESVSVAWDKTNFIGRGEPIFTYNNTVRTGTLKFKIVVDHPSIINKLRQNDNFSDEDFKKFFRGCKTDKDYVKTSLNYLSKETPFTSKEIKDKLETKIVKEAQKVFKREFNDTTPAGGTDTFSTKIFFPNASSTVDPNYDSATQTGVIATPVDPDLGISTQNYLNTINSNLNSTSNGFQNPDITNKIAQINSESNQVEKINITITVASTNIGGPAINDILSNNRATSAENWIRSQLSSISSDKIQVTINRPVIVNIQGSSDPTSQIEKEGRYALIEVTVTKKSLIPTGSTTVETTVFSDKTVQEKISQTIVKTYGNVYKECDYFYYLEKYDPFIFDKFRDKLKYFHPGFHSTTPEGLNSRLTFLHQCTRQGPAISDNGAKSNLAFGRPPFLILRIGDFFHTKMVIESMTIQYDEGVLWDLNPEGIGVQPRLASVSLTVSYLGGQSLYSPIRQLQNALGFNFYANTETFQHAPTVISQEVSTQVNPIGDKKNTSTTPPFDINSLTNNIPGMGGYIVQPPLIDTNTQNFQGILDSQINQGIIPNTTPIDNFKFPEPQIT